MRNCKAYGPPPPCGPNPDAPNELWAPIGSWPFTFYGCRNVLRTERIEEYHTLQSKYKKLQKKGYKIYSAFEWDKAAYLKNAAEMEAIERRLTFIKHEISEDGELFQE